MELEYEVHGRFALKCMELEYEMHGRALKCMKLEFNVHGRYAWNWSLRCMGLKCMELEFQVQRLHGKYPHYTPEVYQTGI